MEDSAWWITFGGVLLLVHATSTSVARLPLSPAMLYLGVGALLGPWGIGWIDLVPARDRVLLERMCEAGVLVSLFATGSNLGSTLHGRHWGASVRLATVAMLVTIALLAAFAGVVLGLPWGAALILAAALAPTDPVLAGDVQVADPADRDRLRFGLTGEAGLNDGAAFPFVLIGLVLLGIHDPPPGGAHWFVLALAWGIVGGIAIGAGMGLALGRWLLHRRRTGAGGAAPDAFFGLGLMAAAYGVAVAAHAYGFLAVFSAAVALQWAVTARSEARATRRTATAGAMSEATAPIRKFNAELESFVELALVVLLGALWASLRIPVAAAAVALLLFLAIRPVAVCIALLGSAMRLRQRALAAWFGIRGIGSVYYVFFAFNQGWRTESATEVLAMVVGVVICSIVVHGVSVTPLMNSYARWRNVPVRRPRR